MPPFIPTKLGWGRCARNIGLQAALGDYIAFVDADDWVESTMFEKLVNATEKYDSDMTICAIFRTDDPRNPCDSREGTCKNDIVFKGKKRINQYMQMFMLKGKSEFRPYFLLGYPWATLYRKTLLQKNDIKFISGMQYKEDVLFNLYAAQFADCIVRINEPLYHVNENNPYSLTTSMLRDEMLPHVEKDITERKLFYMKYKLKDTLFEQGLYQHICRSFIRLVVRTCIFDYNYQQCKNMLHHRTYEEAFSKINLLYMSMVKKIAIRLIQFHGLKLYYALSRFFLRIKARRYNVKKFSTILIRQDKLKSDK